MDAALMASITEGLSSRMLELSVPKFSLGYKRSLKETLKNMGMKTTFIPGSADFSGMGGAAPFIEDVIHEAVVDVDEYGTEAAAATAVVLGGGCDGGGSSGTPVTIDRPFIFMIRDLPTNTILFMGRVKDPSQ